MSNNPPSECGRLFTPYHAGPRDEHGCVLPEGHDGHHLFVDPDGVEWAWEYDMDCDCPDCCKADFSSQCILYWEKR